MENFRNRELIERAEDLILRLRDVKSCRISTDEFGNITEIHVVAESDRSPKLIARDVETCLNAELGLSVDYRKIGVVLLESERAGEKTKDEIGEEGSSARELLGIDEGVDVKEGALETGTEKIEYGVEFLEEDVRVKFKGLKVSLEEDRVDVEVTLEKNGIEVIGSSGSIRHSGDIKEIVAAATVHALSELFEESFNICLAGLKEMEIEDRGAVAAVVDIVEGRKGKSFIGCVFIGKDANEAAVLAVLDAINRPASRWKSRKEIHYTIK